MKRDSDIKSLCQSIGSDKVGLRHVVLVDKPSGITSREAVEKAQKILGAKKAGHTGTLDTKVSGLLIICLDEAVKAMPLLIGLDKTYGGVIRLHGDVNIGELVAACKRFVGRIKQVPPVKSRVARKEREREIFYFKLGKKTGKDVEFEVKCEAGTYIRKLVHNLGQTLGVGAHMSFLRRTGVGPFSDKESVKLGEISEGSLIRLEDVLEKVDVKKVVVKQSVLNLVRNGRPITTDFIIKMDKTIEPGDPIAVFASDQVIAIGEAVRSYLEYSFDLTRKGHRHIYVKVGRVFNG